MVPRILQPTDNYSFFLFGPRATGKTTLLKHMAYYPHALFINLLKPEEENRFANHPEQLEAIVQALPDTITHVIIDEIQKLPKLLDLVHHLIESTNKRFILTGSSARKLKHGGANLLAGRAFVYHLFTFNVLEVTTLFQLNMALRFGMLPKIFSFATEDEKIRYLYAYTHIYLKEEIWAEQLVKKLDPFRRFLEVAAQMNGKIINFSAIANDVGVKDHVVKTYYSILEDTLIGFFLDPFQHSFRKRLNKKPKFYFFDTGIVRALNNQLSLPLNEKTSQYGEIFEHFIILQIMQLCSYFYPDYRLSYLKTKDDAEIDLVVERPGQTILFIEIKSTTDVQAHHLRTLTQLSQDFGECESICLSQDPYAKKFDTILVLPWLQGLKQYFEKTQ